MPTTTEERCPACPTPPSSTRRSRPAIGRPFLTCESCGAFVARGPFEEWSAMPAAARLRLVLSELVLALGLGLLPALLFGVLGSFGGPAPSRSRLLVAAAAGVLLALVVWLRLLAGRIRASRRRMGDPMYRAKLVEFELAGASRAADGERGLAV